MFDQVASHEITLVNTGKVGFDFCCLHLDPALAKKPKPGVPIMVPHAVSTLLHWNTLYAVGFFFNLTLNLS